MNPIPHYPVLLIPVLAHLQIQNEGCYVDATFGRGGHSRAILEKLGPKGRLFAFDWDPEAEKAARMIEDERLHFEKLAFDELKSWLEQHQILGQVNGILLDLGLSSPQLDTPERGFSFQYSGPLDMRMDPERGISAADWLAKVDYKTLVWVLRNYGEERFAHRIAKSIIKQRGQRAITTTDQLATLVKAAIPKWPKHIHPATRTFQAIRIYINDELGQLERLLKATPEILASGGRLVVISFHSLEDRIVKRFIKAHTEDFNIVTRRPLMADETEIQLNPRARSAKMRVAERV